MLPLVLLSDNNNCTISILFSCAAYIKAVLLNIYIIFHEKFENFNTMNNT